MLPGPINAPGPVAGPNQARDHEARSTGVGIHFAAIETQPGQQAPTTSTFYWTDEQCWEGRDHRVEVVNE